MPSLKNSITAEISAAGYNIKHSFRVDKRGGGVALIHKKDLSFKTAVTHKFESFECISATLPRKSHTSLNFVVVYRKDAVPNSLFFSEFYNFIEAVQKSHSDFIFCGDFNLHLNNSFSPDVKEFNHILSAFNLSQHVNGPTHILGNTLDLIITSADVGISNIKVDLNTSSDHAMISFLIKTKTDIAQNRVIQSRKCLDVTAFKNDLSTNCDILAQDLVGKNFNDAIAIFSAMCSNLLDNHAPARDIPVKVVSQPKWMDSEFKNARRQRRSLYKKYCKTKQDIDKVAYKNCSKLVNDLSIQKRKQFYAKTIKDCSNSQKELYKVCNSLLDKQKSTLLPDQSNDNPMNLATQFNSFFIGKIEKIRSNFSAKQSLSSTSYFQGATFSEFLPISSADLSKIIHSKPIKASKNDHIPAFLLKQCLDEVIPMFTLLINLSLASGSMDGLKDSIVTPLLKKQGLNPEDLSNYRPVCDLKYLGKLIEKAVLPQLNSHMASNHLHIDYQSGYKSNHSCETLLLRIVNDIFVHMDDGKCVVLILLDLSAAFDTVDHYILLWILYNEIGLRGTVFQWFESYLHGRRQCVTINNNKSDFTNNNYGVPQGSVLGPVLFNIYV